MNKLHVAAMAGDLQGVRDAIASGIDVDSVESAHGNTALMLAAYNNRPSVIGWLIGSGANVNARCKQENTALMKAAWSGATECVAALLRAGADVNVVDREGMTSLMIAAFHGHSDAVMFLVEGGADTNRTDRDGYTALRNARERGHEAIAGFLERAVSSAPKLPADNELSESSMNFDLEDLGPFLVEVADQLASGFTKAQAQKVASAIARLAVDDEKAWTFQVVYEGSEMPMRIEAFMDDVDAPDVAFHAPPRLSSAIEDRMKTYLK